MNRLALLPLAALVGCACPEILSVTPADGTGPVARDAVIRVALDGEAKDATFTVEGPDGPIAGTVSLGATEAVFTPSELLPAGAEIDYTVEICDGTASGTFTVGNIDSASEPSDLEGNTYALDLTNADWVTPPTGGALIAQFFDGAVLVGVESVTDAELDAIGASGQETQSGAWQQDPCFATIDFEPVDFTTNPYFAIRSDVIAFTVQDTTVPVHNMEISGGLTAEEVVDGRFAGEIDFREIDVVNDGCSLIGMVGLSCTACSSDDEPFCVFVEAENVDGAVVPGLALVPNENPQECN